MQGIQDFRYLKVTEDASFPKVCGCCGKCFENVGAFFADTEPSGHHTSGLRQGVDDNQKAIVEAFRNCPCGSTLMMLFEDRRKTSRVKKQAPISVDTVVD